MTLTKEEFEAEKRYQILMVLTRGMLREGLITAGEYAQTAVGYAARISPRTGSLLALNGLLFVPERGRGNAGEQSAGSVR